MQNSDETLQSEDSDEILEIQVSVETNKNTISNDACTSSYCPEISAG